jgi:hypothetical protein
MTITDDIKNKIKNRKIEPKAKWRFCVANISWWFLFVILFIVCSVAFGIIVYIFKGADWEVARLVATGIWGRLLLVLPRLWLLLIIITTAIAVWEFRKTKKGYRYDIITILAVVLIGSVIFGSLVYASGLGERLDSLLTDRMPLYRGRLHQQMDLWDRVDNGLLMGRVVDYNEVEISLQAPRGPMWLVDISNINETLNLDINLVVKVTGQKVDDQYFIADTISVLEMRRFKGGHKPPMKHFMSPMNGTRHIERF